ncbi:MAG: hypothetical protein IT371_24025 [Deltaproteobacteria bacterium]|nr:hypothetical protein [Deltaproteobacteria bacterium]
METSAETSPSSARPAVTFGLSLSEGRGLVTLAEPRTVSPVEVERLELEIPDLRFPFDLSGGASRFRHRRCQLRRARLTIAEEPFQSWLGGCLDRAAYGFRQVRIQFRPNLFEVAGQVVAGSHAAEFLFRGTVHPAEGRWLRVGLSDARVFQAFPVPAPHLAAALLQAAGAQPRSAVARKSSTVFLLGCTEVLFDPLATTLLHTLPRAGWRLPRTEGVALEEVALLPGALVLDYAFAEKPAARKPGGTSTRIRRLNLVDEAKELFRELEAELLETPPAAAVARYRERLESTPGHPFLYERLLQLMVTDSSYDEETLALVEECRRDLGDVPFASLAEAVVAARLGDPETSARAYRRIAEAAGKDRDRTEEVLAWAAAGATLLEVDPEAAREDFEKALALQRDHRRTLTHLSRLYAELGEWARLAQLRQRQLALATTDGERLGLHLALGELHRIHLGEPGTARGHYERALELDPGCEPALNGLADAALEADDPAQAIYVLDRLCALSAARGDVDGQVGTHLRVATIWGHFGDRPAALARLTHARELGSRDPAALKRIGALLETLGQPEAAAEVLGEALLLVPDPAGRLPLHRELATLYAATLGNLAAAAEQVAAALALGPPDRETARLALQVAEARGETAAIVEALGRSAAVESDRASRAQLLLRQGLLLAGQEGHEERAAAALERAVKEGGPSANEAARALALVEERRGGWEAAARSWRRALEGPVGAEDTEGWLRLGRVELRLDHDEAALGVLERVSARAEGAPLREALLLLADLRRKRGETGELESTLRRLLPLVPAEGEAALRRTLLAELADLEEAREAHTAAVASLEEARALGPPEAWLLARLGTLYERLEAWTAARAALDEALALGEGASLPQAQAALCVRLGAISRALARPREAVGYYRRALDLGLEDESATVAVWDRIVEVHLSRSDGTAAARAAESSAAAPASPLAQAQRLYEAGQLWLRRAELPGEATRCFYAALGRAPHHGPSLDALESLLTRTDDRVALTEVLARKVEAAAHRPTVQRALLVRRAETLLSLGERDEAREALAGALARDPQCVPALHFFADETWERGARAAAADLYERLAQALHSDETSGSREDRHALLAKAHLRLAEVARDGGDADTEELELGRALAANSDRREAWARLDELLAPTDRHAELLEILAHRARLAAGREEAAHFGLRRAQLLQRTDQSAEAYRAYRDVLEVLPTSLEALRGATALARELGHRRELLNLLERLAAAPAEEGNRPTGNRAGTAGRWLEVAELAAELADRPRALAALEQLFAAPSADSRELDLGLASVRHLVPAESLPEWIGRRAARESVLERRARWELERAEALRDLGRAEEAEECLDLALREGCSTVPLLRAAAELAEEGERWGLAAERYERMRQLAHARHPQLESVALESLLRLALGPLAHPARAEALCRALLELRPDDPFALQIQSHLLEQREAWREVVPLLQRLWALLESRHLSLAEELALAIRLARALCRTDAADEGLTVVATAVSRCGSAIEQLASLWLGTREIGLLEAELLVLRALVALRPLEDGPWRRLAEILQSRADAGDARAVLTQALIVVRDTAARARVARALLELRGDLQADAELDALEALRHGDATVEELVRLAQRLAAARRHAEALAVLSDLPVERRSSDELRALTWRLLDATGDHAALAAAQERHADSQASPAKRAEWLAIASRTWIERAGRADDALRCARQALAAQPTALDRAEELARSLANAGATTQALTLLEECAADPGLHGTTQGPRLLCRAARLHLALGTPWREAAELLERALREDPACEEALDALAELYDAHGDEPALLRLLCQKGEVGSSATVRAAALLRAARLLAARPAGRDEALSLARRAEKLSDDPQRLWEVAELQQTLAALEGAEETLTRLAEHPAHGERALARACGLARRRGDAAAQGRYLQQLARLKPDDPLVSHRLIEAYREAENLDGLRASLEALAEREPAARLELAQLCAGPLDDVPAARAAYRALLARDSGHAPALRGLLALSLEAGLYADAVDCLARLHDLEPLDATTLRGQLSLQRATILRDRLADLDGARSAFLDAARELGGGETWAEALRQLVAIGEPEETLSSLQALAHAGLAREGELVRLAALAETHDRTEVAIDAYERLRLIAPSSETTSHLAELLRTLGDSAKAAELHGELAALALARGAADEAARAWLRQAEAFEAAGADDRCRHALRQAVDARPTSAEVTAAVGEALRRTGERRGLAALLEGAFDHGPPEAQPALLEELVALYEAGHEADHAAGARRRLFQLRPDRTDLLVPLLRHALERAELPEARQLLDRCAAGSLLDPTERAEHAAHLAQLELTAERVPEARARALEALAHSPVHPRALRVLRDVGLRTGDYLAVAEAHLALAGDGTDDETVNHLRQAGAALGLLPEQHPRCIEVYQRILALRPEDTRAADALESLLRQRRDPGPLADLLWRQLARLGPPEQRARYLELATLEEQARRPERAEAALRQALALAPEESATLIALVEHLGRHSQWPAAAELLEAHLAGPAAEGPHRAELAEQLGRAYLDHLSQPAPGLRWLRAACTWAPTENGPFERLVALLREQQAYEELALVLEQRVTTLPSARRPPLWEELGQLREHRLRDLRGAAEAYLAAFREQPTPHLPWALRAEELFLRSDAAESSLAVLEESLARVDPSHHARLFARRARVKLRIGQAEGAIADYGHALELDPTLHEAHAALGQCFVLEGRLADAVPHLQEAADHLGDSRKAAACAFRAGQALESLGLPEEALGRYEQAVALDPLMVHAHRALVSHYVRGEAWEKLRVSLSALVATTVEPAERAAWLTQLAQVHVQLGQLDDAAAQYELALASAPEHLPALSALRELCRERGAWPRHAALLRTEIRLTEDPARRVSLKRELGYVLARQLDEPGAAIDALLDAVADDGGDRESGLALLPLLEGAGRHGEAGRLAQELSVGATSVKERRELLLRAALDHQSAGWADEARHLFRRLSSGDDETAHVAAARLLDLAIESGPPALRRATPVRVTAPLGHLALDPPAPAGNATPTSVTMIPALGELAIRELLDASDWEGAADALRSQATTMRDGLGRAELLISLGRLLEERLRRPTDALATYAEAAAAAPQHRATIETWADAAYRHQDWPRAREAYDRLAQLGGAAAVEDFSFRRGVICEAIGDEGSAETHYAQAVIENPSSRPALEGRARLALFRDDTRTAIEALSSLLRLVSVDEIEELTEIREQLGELFLRTGDSHRAREYLEAVLVLDSRRLKAMQLLLTAYEELGEHDASAELLQQMIFRTGDPLVRASLLHHRASILASRLGNEEEAVDCLLKAYDIAPQHAPTLWRLIDYYWQLGDVDSVAQMGDDLSAAVGGTMGAPDLRHVRLAAAALLARQDLETATSLLRHALSEPELTEPALVDLASTVGRGAPVGLVASLIRKSDESGRLRQAAPLVLRDRPKAPGLAELVDELRSR